jgi:hypothetical protein
MLASFTSLPLCKWTPTPQNILDTDLLTSSKTSGLIEKVIEQADIGIVGCPNSCLY